MNFVHYGAISVPFFPKAFNLVSQQELLEKMHRRLLVLDITLHKVGALHDFSLTMVNMLHK